MGENKEKKAYSPNMTARFFNAYSREPCAAKPNNRNSVPRTHKVEGSTDSLNCPLISTCMS